MKLKKVLSLGLALSLTATLFAGCGAPAASSSGAASAGEKSSAAAAASEKAAAPASGTLTLYTWENMFPQEVLDGFTQETGIKVNYQNFDTGETMLTKLSAAKGGDYDLVVVDDYIVEKAVQEDLVLELDTAKIANYASINPLFQKQFFDPEDKYTVPYGSGVQTIVYDPAIISKEITGYADLWDAALKDNVGIIANYRVINGMALKVLGESYNVEDVAKIEEAGKKLLELTPNIRLIKDDNLQDDLISGEVGAAVMYTSQVTLAKLANPNLEVVFPKEGLGFGIMAQFIPKNAPNAEAAYQFMDYILRPEVSAKCYEFMGYYCTNKDADALIAEEYREFLTLPADFTADKMEMIQNVSAEAEDAHSKAWTEFKASCE